MSKLNFDFPIILDVDATRERHTTRIEAFEKMRSGREFSKHAGAQLFEGAWTEDDLFEVIYHTRYKAFQTLRHYSGTGQKLVKGIKTEVNQYVRHLIGKHLEHHCLPASWDTAYYLVYQKELDAKMKQVSIMIHQEIA